MENKTFGTLSDGTVANLYTIANTKGMHVAITDYGANVVSVVVNDKDGKATDVILGYDDVSAYEHNLCYFGATVGCNCNRISNAEIEIDGVKYALENNDRGNNLHSGSDGLSRKMWQVKEYQDSSITFIYHKADLEEGYPGNATIEVTYAVTEDNDMSIHYYAVADKKTVFNMTNHCYFNLGGHASGTVLAHTLQINASRYTPVKDNKSIPTGEMPAVEGTPFDFRTAKTIGQDIHADHEQIAFADGYDHNFVLDRKGTGLEKVATAYCPTTGIQMDVLTECVAVQLYTANGILGQVGKGNTAYPNYGAFCLETQYCPNAINEPNFETPVFDAGVPYDSKTSYHFSICTE